MAILFAVDDLVTGKDRSYERSIYKLAEIIDDEHGIYVAYAYGGLLLTDDYSSVRDGIHRRHNEFRLATPFEITKSSAMSWRYLLNVLGRLEIKSANVQLVRTQL